LGLRPSDHDGQLIWQGKVDGEPRSFIEKPASAAVDRGDAATGSGHNPLPAASVRPPGSKSAIIHFPAGKLPPARFFWSVTLYRLPDRFLYANEIDRYSVGDRTQGVRFGPDGSLTIYLSHASLPADRKANWLPAPEGEYVIVAGIYGPKPDAIDGSWKLPPLQSLSPQ
jgi:Protein of unknown function (DUF1214)